MDSGCAIMASQTALSAACATDNPVVAVSCQRFGIEPRITPLLSGIDALGYSRFEDQLSTPKGSKSLSVKLQFDYPSQWSRLPPQNTITLVDGNSGLKVYCLQVRLPEATALAETPKAFLADAIFAPAGSLSKSGASIEEYKVSSAKMVEAPDGGESRKLALKYTVVTPANQRIVERRALANVYQVDEMAYILLASATSSKWESGEKERCQRVVDSFVISR